MTITGEDIYELARLNRGTGIKARDILVFLGENRHKPLAFFVEKSESGELDPRHMRNAVNGVGYGVRGHLSFHTNEGLLKTVDMDQVESVLGSQLDKWCIPKRITKASPYFLVPGASEAGMKDNIGAYNITCLRGLNCMTEFYFGERFLPSIKPAVEYEPQTFISLVEAENNVSNEHEFRADEMDKMQTQLWEQGYLQCDITR